MSTGYNVNATAIDVVDSTSTYKVPGAVAMKITLEKCS